MGSLFTGSYFFDACFWPVSIPIGWGQFKLDALAALETMPDTLKCELKNNVDEFWVYVLYWADCLDYAYGFDDICKIALLPSLAVTFLKNADKELISAVSQVNSQRPNPKAILTARMATEIFLKALLVGKRGFSEQELKALGHDVAEVAYAANEACQTKELEIIKNLAHVFPPMAHRYTGPEYSLQSVWEGLSLAQMAAATVVRQFSDHDVRPQIFGQSDFRR